MIAETDSSNTVQKEYVFGDDLISQTGEGVTHYFMTDGLGSTRSLTDSSGNASDAYFYDAFGNTLAQTGSTDNDYLYTGEQFDSALNNYYLRARYYDQSVGRFTQMDTWMGKMCTPITLNKYIYANADAVNWIDPTGRSADLGSAITSSALKSNLQSLAVNQTYRVMLKRGANRLMCVFVEEAVEEAIVNGIYVLATSTLPYVGQSIDIDTRFEQHKNNTKRSVKDVLAKFDFPYTRNSKRVLEQFMMQFIDDVFGGNSNGRLEIATEPASKNSQRLRRIVNSLDFCKK